MNDRMFFPAGNVRVGSLRMPPVGARNITPPKKMVIQRNFGEWGLTVFRALAIQFSEIGRSKYDRARHEHFRGGIGKIFGIGLSLGDGKISGGADESFELFIRDF